MRGLRTLRIEFDLLAVAQVRQGFLALGVEGDLRARVAVQFEEEALALAGDRRRLDHAALEDDDLAPGSLDFGRGSGSVQTGGERSAKEERQMNA